MVPSPDFIASFPFAALLGETAPNLGRAAGRFHPLLVHFPIALGLVAVGAEWWRGLSRREGLSPLTLPLLWLAAVSAVFSTATGWINASFEHDGNTSDALMLHRWIGTLSSVALVGLAFWCQALAAQTAVASAKAVAALGTFRWAALVGAIGVSVTGHFGGDLVHGSGYTTDWLLPAAAKPTEAPESSDGASLAANLNPNEEFFLEKVRPILEVHCFECHGARKQKGGLRMDTRQWLFNGGEERWSVLPRKAAESLLVHRVELDRTDPDAMPPEGDGLTAEEIAALRQWIDAGADYPAAGGGGAAGVPGLSSSATTAALAAAGSVAIGGPVSAEIPPAVRAKADVAAKALIARGVLVQPLAAESPLLDVNASRAEPAFGDADAALLSDIAPVVANLNLAKSAITDAGLAKLGPMPHLERLRLDGTAAGDAGVRALGTLPRLESINLVGAKVTAALADWVASQPALRRVYVWQTALDTPDAMKAMTAGGRIQAVGADLQLAQPKGPPMPEDPKPAEAAPAAAPADAPADGKPAA